MRRLCLTIFCLALFFPVARASAAPAESVQEHLSPGVFCKSHGWLVNVKDAGTVKFKLNGKVDKTLKF